MSEIDTLLVGGTVYPCDGPAVRAIPNGVVAITGEHLSYVGPAEGAPTDAKEVVELDGRAVLPGLVDPHTHLVFAGSRVDEFSRRMAGEDYRTIAAKGGGIKSTVRATREASDQTLFENARLRALTMRRLGITSLEVKSGYGLTLHDELRSLRVARRLSDEKVVRTSPTFLGAHSVPPEYQGRRDAYVTHIVDEMLPAVASEKLAQSCDVYCDDGAFTLEETRRVLEAARNHGLAVRAHVGQFADLGGPQLLGEMGALSADHLEAISDDGLRALADGGVVAVLLPGAWRTLRQTPPSASRFRDAGVSIAVGTDLNPGTSPCVDLPLAAALAVRDAGLKPHEAILGMTRIAAQAAGLSEVGQLKKGMNADIAIFPFADAQTLVYALGSVPAWQVYLAGERLESSPEHAQSLWH